MTSTGATAIWRYESDDLAVGIAWVVEDLNAAQASSTLAARSNGTQSCPGAPTLYEELLEARQKVSPP